MEVKFVRGEVVFETETVRLHKFSSPISFPLDTPVLIIPPHAGRTGCIVQNMVDALVKEGKTVYAYDLKSATFETRYTSVLDLIQFQKDFISLIKQIAGSDDPIDVIGVCQGGWIAAMFTALYPKEVKRLALFAAPINTKTGENNSIEEYCKEDIMPLARLIVKLNYGIQPGFCQWMAFALANPAPVFYDRYMKKFKMILEGDQARIAKWNHNENWYDTPVNLAGVWFLDALENHFKKNKLFGGEWRLGPGATPNLNQITCPLFVYAGGKDTITHPRQALDITRKVNTPPQDIHTKVFVNDGHTNVFCRKSSIDFFITEFYCEEEVK